jgi:hypothetical protein
MLRNCYLPVLSCHSIFITTSNRFNLAAVRALNFGSFVCNGRTKTISVIPIGANGNIGKTGPGWRLGSEVVGLTPILAPHRFCMAVSRPRGAPPLGWYLQPLQHWISRDTPAVHRTHPRPAGPAQAPQQCHALRFVG